MVKAIAIWMRVIPASSASTPRADVGDRGEVEPLPGRPHQDELGSPHPGVQVHSTVGSNGLLEGTNSLVQAAKRRARGYRSKQKMITIIYLIAGRLPLSPTHSL